MMGKPAIARTRIAGERILDKLGYGELREQLTSSPHHPE